MVIGVNKYKREEAQIPNKLFMVDQESERLHCENVASIKAKRNKAKVENDLGELRRVAEAKASGRDINIVPAMIQAVRDDVTVGEIFSLLREIYGEYKAQVIF